MKNTHTPYERELIGKRLREVRLEKGWTAKELGGRVTCSHNTVSDYERGIPVRLVLLHQFAEALGISEEWLETGRGAREPAADARPPEPRHLIDTEFLHRCLVAVAAWAPAHTAPLDATALACRLYEMFHDDGASDEQLRKFLERWMSFTMLQRPK